MSQLFPIREYFQPAGREVVRFFRLLNFACSARVGRRKVPQSRAGVHTWARWWRNLGQKSWSALCRTGLVGAGHGCGGGGQGECASRVWEREKEGLRKERGSRKGNLTTMTNLSWRFLEQHSSAIERRYEITPWSFSHS